MNASISWAAQLACSSTRHDVDDVDDFGIAGSFARSTSIAYRR